MPRNKQYTPLGRKIAQLAKNQEELAQVLGLTQQSVSGKLRGTIGVTIQDIEGLSRHYSVPKIYFLAPVEMTPDKAHTFERFLAGPEELYEALKIAADMPESIAGPLLNMVRAMQNTVALCSSENEAQADQVGLGVSIVEYLKA